MLGGTGLRRRSPTTVCQRRRAARPRWRGRSASSSPCPCWACSACASATCSRPASACGATTSRSAGAFRIVNFVFWVGIGHAGTLISAILFLFRQNWRTGINRFAEAMTIFAVMCAAMFPGIHVGRPWLAYWLFPIPNQMSMWPQFRSPAAVGRVCGRHLCDGLGAVLVHGHGARPGDASATGRPARSSSSPTASSPWAGTVRAGTGIATSGPI